MRADVFVKQLIALRAQSVATVAAVDAVIAQLNEDAKASEPPPSKSLPEEDQPPPGEGCAHPIDARLKIPTMGHPNRYFCQKCQTEQEE